MTELALGASSGVILPLIKDPSVILGLELNWTCARSKPSLQRSLSCCSSSDEKIPKGKLSGRFLVLEERIGVLRNGVSKLEFVHIVLAACFVRCC